MFRSLEIENCYSFYKTTKLNFIVNNNAPKTDRYLKSCISGERLTKVVAVFGHNGSGKSSLLTVINFLKFFILESFGDKPDEGLSLQPFLLKEKPFASSKIKVEFECQDTIYRYFVEINKNVILHEELEKLDLNKKRTNTRNRFKKLFERVYKKRGDGYEIKAAAEFKLNEGLRDLAKKRNNASLISAGIFTNHPICLELKKYWKTVIAKVRNNVFRPFPSDVLLMRSSEFYYRNQQFKTKMESMMLRSDLGVVGIDIEKVKLPNAGELETNNQEFYMPYGKHAGIKNKIYRLPFYYESGGTQQIYILLSSLLPALDRGGLAVIDELETDLHPEVLPVLFDLFYSKDTNPNGAQLIFTCHAITLLKNLDKYQVVMVNKDKEGMSTAKRLDSEKVRSDDNLLAKYQSGAFGGKPNLI